MPEETPGAALGTHDVARLLTEIGILLELTDDDAFRARAFATAARALEGCDADLHALAREDRLTTLRGVGSGIASVIREYVLTGQSTLHDELRAATPLGLYDLLRVPGLGPKRIHTLHRRLGIDSLDALERAATAGEVAVLPGFGAKTERKILSGIAFARSNRKLRRYPEALEAAARIVDWLRALPGVAAVEIAGQLRRRMEIVDRIDLVAATEDCAAVLRSFAALDDARVEGNARADEAVLTLPDGVAVRLRCVAPPDFVTAMVWETGNDAHRAGLADIARSRGVELDGDRMTAGDLTVVAETESDLYGALGLDYVPPELREGLDELARAAERTLPRLIESDDLRGAFHCHTTYSDGKASVAEMADAARRRGWSYLGLADHSRSASYAGGLALDRIHAQHEEVDGLNEGLLDGDPPFRIFKGIESDILRDGSLDYPDDVLARFDYVVGSVHSSFGMARDEMTRRMVRAISHPALTILGHPTGRRLLSRAGYEVDVDALIAAAVSAGVVIEINANPQRLDLDWRYARAAAELGVLFAVNPDAHSIAGLDHVAFGINVARKAGLEPRQVLNTWTLDEISDYFAQRKQQGQERAGG